jgi:thiamine-phosphate pyrophosphorylase
MSISYLITDPKYYTSNPETFQKVLTGALQTSDIQIACFRDKISSNFNELALVFVNTCKLFNIKYILINSNINLAYNLNISGVHLTSTQFNKIKEAKSKNLFVIISCHSQEEIEKAQQYGANMVTYSPIFNTPNKGMPKGCKDLTEVISRVDIPVIALGGILTLEQIKDIKKSKAVGFASIRYFLN